MNNPGETVMQRFDIYRPIHKAVRACMADTLQRIGNTDGADETEVAGSLQQLRVLVAFLGMHLKKENTFVHPAMEARRPGSSGYIAADHEHHEFALGKLERLAAEVEQSHGDERNIALLQLYRFLAVFVADNLTHMNTEESDNNAVLWAVYSDAELVAIEQAIVGSLQPEEKAIGMRWMLPALSHGERVGFLSGMRTHVPPFVFESVLAIARAHLREGDYRKLAAALQLEEPLAA
jgi:hypothetical protein